jgi:hypothetical protein
MKKKRLIFLIAILALIACGVFYYMCIIRSKFDFVSSCESVEVSIMHDIMQPKQEAPTSTSAVSVQGLRLSDLKFDPASVEMYQGSQAVYFSINNIAIINIEVSTKGNGFLSIQQRGKITLTIPIYDCHREDDEYYVFDEDMLNYDFVDIDNDGTLDFIIKGKLIFRNDDKVISTWPIRDIYRYDNSQNQWLLWQTNGPDEWIKRLNDY